MSDRSLKISEDMVEQIRKLKGIYQSENPSIEMSNRETVKWAIENEIERKK